MNKCFLLLLIIVCIYYNSQPLIEAFDESSDNILDYDNSEKGSAESVIDSILSRLYGSTETTGDAGAVGAVGDAGAVDDICSSYDSVVNCGLEFAGSSTGWSFGDTFIRSMNGEQNNKDNCATCMECKDGGRFIKSYYAPYCNALVSGCGDGDPGNPDMVPFNYALHVADWGECGTSSVTTKQRATCNMLGSTPMDYYKLYTLGDRIDCALDVAGEQF